MYDEDALRSATAWHYVHLHRTREVMLPVGSELTFLATVEGFFKAMNTEMVVESAWVQCFLI